MPAPIEPRKQSPPSPPLRPQPIFSADRPPGERDSATRRRPTRARGTPIAIPDPAGETCETRSGETRAGEIPKPAPAVERSLDQLATSKPTPEALTTGLDHLEISLKSPFPPHMSPHVPRRRPKGSHPGHVPRQ